MTGPARPGQHGGVPVAVPGVRGDPRAVGDARRRWRAGRRDPRPRKLVRRSPLGEPTPQPTQYPRCCKRIDPGLDMSSKRAYEPQSQLNLRCVRLESM